MSRQFYSNPQLSRISSNLSRALLGSASDDAAIARSRLTNAQAAGVELGNQDIRSIGEQPGLVEALINQANPNFDFTRFDDPQRAAFARSYTRNPSQFASADKTRLETQPSVRKLGAETAAAQQLANKRQQEATAKQMQNEALKNINSPIFSNLALTLTGQKPGADGNFSPEQLEEGKKIINFILNNASPQLATQAIERMTTSPDARKQEAAKTQQEEEKVRGEGFKTSKAKYESIDAQRNLLLGGIKRARERIKKNIDSQKLLQAKIETGMKQGDADFQKVKQELERLKLEEQVLNEEARGLLLEEQKLTEESRGEESFQRAETTKQKRPVQVENLKKEGESTQADINLKEQNLSLAKALAPLKEEKLESEIDNIDTGTLLKDQQITDRIQKRPLEKDNLKKTGENIAERTGLVKKKTEVLGNESEKNIKILDEKIKKISNEVKLQDRTMDSKVSQEESKAEKEKLRVTELQRKLAKTVKIPPAQANAFVKGWTSTTSNIENWDKIPGAARNQLFMTAAKEFAANYKGTKGDANKEDVLNSTLAATQSLKMAPVAILDGYLDPPNFYIPGQLYEQLSTTFSQNPEGFNAGITEIRKAIEKKGYSSDEVDDIIEEITSN